MREPPLDHRGRRAGRLGQEHAGAPAGGRISALAFLDTGLLYRAVARPPARRGAAARRRRRGRRGRRTRSDAGDLTSPRLRDEAVSQGASKVAAIAGGARGAAGLPAQLRRRRPRRGAGRPRHRHRGLPGRRLQDLRHRHARGARAAALQGVAGAAAVATIYERVLEELRERDRARSVACGRAVACRRRTRCVLDTTEQDVDAAFAIARAHVAAGRHLKPSSDRVSLIANPSLWPRRAGSPASGTAIWTELMTASPDRHRADVRRPTTSPPCSTRSLRASDRLEGIGDRRAP